MLPQARDMKKKISSGHCRGEQLLNGQLAGQAVMPDATGGAKLLVAERMERRSLPAVAGIAIRSLSLTTCCHLILVPVCFSPLLPLTSPRHRSSIAAMFWLNCGRRSYCRELLPGRKAQPSHCRTCSGSSDKNGHQNIVAPGRGQLVYEGSLTRVVKGVKLFSLSTSSLGLAIQSVLYLKMSAAQTNHWVFVFAGSIATIVLMSPLLLHYITKRYVTHLYYEPGSRTFTTCSLTLFNRKRMTTFTAKDVVIPTIQGPFTTYTVFRKPYFIDPLSFKDISVFEHLVGYDQLDQKLRGAGRPEDQTENDGPEAVTGEKPSASSSEKKSG